MVFIMRVCRKSNAIFIILWGLCLGAQASWAGDRFVKIKQVQLVYANKQVDVNARLDFHLSREALTALHSGITLYWDVSLHLKQFLWQGIWSKNLYSQVRRYSLTYYTLLNNYRVRDEWSRKFRRFANVNDALRYMAIIHYKHLKVGLIIPNKCITVQLSVQFDKEALPIPLRPVAYFDKQWDLSANERQWCA